MRTIWLAGFAVTFALMSHLGAQQPGEAPAAEPPELQKLRADFQERQKDALTPVLRWYTGELDALEKRTTQKGDLSGAMAVRRERESALAEAPAGGGAMSGNAASVKRALTRDSWGWLRADRPNTAARVIFKEDGTWNHNRGFGGQWEVTGPRTVQLTDGARKTTITVDPSGRKYEGKDFDGVGLTGERHSR